MNASQRLDTLADELQTYELGDIVELNIGRTPPRGEDRYWTTNVERPFCTISDMTAPRIYPAREGVTELAEREGKARRVPAGALLMSFKLTIGRTAVAGRDLFPNEAIVWIRPREDAPVSQDYLRLYLSAYDYAAVSYTHLTLPTICSV